MLKSIDGGKTFDLVSATHGDHHGLWIDPTDPRRLINGNDGGASISLDGGKTWSTQDNQPTGAFYHVSVRQPGFPYWIYGAQQDNSNVAIASYDDEGVITASDWFIAGGGEMRLRRSPIRAIPRSSTAIRRTSSPATTATAGAGPGHQPVAGGQFGPPGVGAAASVQLDLAADDVAARSRHALRGLRGGVEDD
jgi:hypothetical protein